MLLAESGGDSAPFTLVEVAGLLRLSVFPVSVEIPGESSRPISSAVLVAPIDV